MDTLKFAVNLNLVSLKVPETIYHNYFYCYCYQIAFNRFRGDLKYWKDVVLQRDYLRLKREGVKARRGLVCPKDRKEKQ